MKFKAGSRGTERMKVHERVEKPDRRGNRQQRRAAKKVAKTIKK